MEIGRVDMFEKYIDDLSDKKTLDKLLNDLGYDKGRETSERHRVHSSVERGNAKDQGDQLQGSLQDTDEENVDLRFRSEVVKTTRRLASLRDFYTLRQPPYTPAGALLGGPAAFPRLARGYKVVK